MISHSLVVRGLFGHHEESDKQCSVVVCDRCGGDLVGVSACCRLSITPILLSRSGKDVGVEYRSVGGWVC